MTHPMDSVPMPEPAHWRITDGESGWNFYDEEPELFSVDWAARYGRKHEELYTADQLRAYGLSAYEMGSSEGLEEAINKIKECMADGTDASFFVANLEGLKR